MATLGLDRQFLWGRSLLVTPVLEPGVDSVTGYFPRGVWYDFYTVRSTAALGGDQPAPARPSQGCRWEAVAEPSKPRWRKGWGWLLPRPVPEPPPPCP